MRVALFATALAVLAGCSSVSSSAVQTGPLRLPPRSGPVALFAARTPAAGAELGMVEVHASQTEATIETLMPLFAERVAGLGGNAAVIDFAGARFELVPRPITETYVYPCGGWGRSCIGTRFYAVNDEVMTVSIRGRAFAIPHGHPEAPR